MTILADSLTALRTNLVNFRLDGWKCLDKLSGLGLNNNDWILCIVGLDANEAADKLGNKRVVVADKWAGTVLWSETLQGRISQKHDLMKV